jgi:hypothetical protein
VISIRFDTNPDQGKKAFFFEKKKQKTFGCLGCGFA